MTTTKKEESPFAPIFRQERVIRQAKERTLSILSRAQYDAGWMAYRENQDVGAVMKAAKVSRAVASILIEEGYPRQDMPSYSSRVTSVRKVAMQIEDYTLARAMTENGQILRGVKHNLRKAMGQNFENVGFSEEAMREMTPRQALDLANFMDKLMKLEAYALNEGKEETLHRVEHHVHGAEPTEAARRLEKLIGSVEHAIQNSPFASINESVIDADFIDRTLEDEENGTD